MKKNVVLNCIVQTYLMKAHVKNEVQLFLQF